MAAMNGSSTYACAVFWCPS